MDRKLSSPENLILVNREPTGIAFVTINRPKSLNSLTKAMIGELAWAIKALNQDDSIRVIILSGAGRAFCSGVDLTAAQDVFKGDVTDLESDPVAQMERCRKPIIAAINGFAITAGFELALACDIVVAAKGAKFIDTHARSVRISFDSDPDKSELARPVSEFANRLCCFRIDLVYFRRGVCLRSCRGL